MNNKSYGSAIGFLDLLFNCLIVFVFMFVVAFAQIEPESKKAVLKTKAEFIITMTWAMDDSNDIDIWLLDPAKNLISFKNKSAGLTHIDRDDLGKSGDVFMTSDGRKVAYEYNQEIVTIRGFIPGQWIVNIHMYKRNQTTKPSVVKIRMDKINPSVTTIVNETIVLEEYWQEETVIRLTMDINGTILSSDKLPISLIRMHPDMIPSTTQSVSPSSDQRSSQEGR